MLKNRSYESFKRESTILNSLSSIKAKGSAKSKLVGFPELLLSAFNDDICIIVQQLFGTNLETLRKKYK